MDLIKALERKQMRTDLPNFKPGDTLRIKIKIKEGGKTRLQAFEGVCIARKHGGLQETFTLRKVTAGIGVERTFPLHSPSLEKIEIRKFGIVRRAKLYYLREKIGKKARIKEKITPQTQVKAPAAPPPVSPETTVTPETPAETKTQAQSSETSQPAAQETPQIQAEVSAETTAPQVVKASSE